MTAAIQYILTAAQSLGSQDYFKRSRMTILGLAGVLFCENEQAQNGLSHVLKKILTWMLMEASGGLKSTVGNRVTTRLSLYSHSEQKFFSISFNQNLVSPGRLCSKACQHILDIYCGPKSG